MSVLMKSIIIKFVVSPLLNDALPAVDTFQFIFEKKQVFTLYNIIVFS